MGKSLLKKEFHLNFEQNILIMDASIVHVHKEQSQDFDVI